MLVKLPCQCSGREIVEVFKVASTFQECSDKKWQAEQFVSKFVYEPGSVKQTARDVGINVYLFLFEKKWGLFGKKVWKLNNSPTFTLNSLSLDRLYKEIEVTIKYVSFGDEMICRDCNSSDLNKIRPQFEKILGNFYNQLQSKHS